MGTGEAAEFLGVSKRRVQQLVETGLLPAERAGRVWVIRQTDAEAFKERLPELNREKQGRRGRPYRG